MSTTILTAMRDMAEDMTAVNASRRQVRGVASWRDAVTAAVAAGQAAGSVSAGQLGAKVPGSRTHAGWMATADAVIATLDSQAAEAEEMATEAREAAEDARSRAQQASARRAQAEADELPAEAAAHAARAQEAADEADEADEAADVFDAWAAAATDAARQGAMLTAREDEIHAPVGAAIAAGGGTDWIADDKHFNTGGS
jgi:hypothetical protein